MSRTPKDMGDVDPLVRFIGTQRELQGYTQTRLAKAAGISGAMYGFYENGKTKITVEKARTLLAILGYKLVAVPLKEDE